MSDRQTSVRWPEPGSPASRYAGRVLLGLVELAVLFVVVVVGRFAFSSLKPSQSRDSSFEGAVMVAPALPGTFMQSVRRGASFDGHAYVYADDPQHPGNYAVVFTPALMGGDERAYAAIRHAILVAYAQDVSGVLPDVSPQGAALRVEFRIEGIAYVAVATWDAAHRELIAFSLHREE